MDPNGTWRVFIFFGRVSNDVFEAKIVPVNVASQNLSKNDPFEVKVEVSFPKDAFVCPNRKGLGPRTIPILGPRIGARNILLDRSGSLGIILMEVNVPNLLLMVQKSCDHLPGWC